MPPQSQAASDEAAKLKKDGVQVVTDTPNKKDPPPKGGGDDSEESQGKALVGAKNDPIAFVMQNKDKLQGMMESDPDKAFKFMDMTFRKYMLPRYKQVNKQFPLSESEIDKLRTRWISQLAGLDRDPIELDKPDPQYGQVAKIAATMEGGGAGVLGGVKTFAELQQKINNHLGPIGKPENYILGKLIPAISDKEHKAFEDAQGVTPTGAKVGAAVGHAIPATIAAEVAGGAVPGASAGSSTATKVGVGAARGAVEGATYGAGTPGGNPGNDAKWGALLGAGFPILKSMFSLGKAGTRVAEAAGETPSAGASAGTPASAASAPIKAANMGDLAEQTAQKHYGKAFKDLSSTERAELLPKMKEEIKNMKAAKTAEATAKKEAVRQAKKEAASEQAAERGKKAEAAKATATTEAAQRASTPETAKSGMPEGTVAQKAAQENPAVAKVLGTSEKYAGTERRAAEGASPTGTERRKTAYEMSSMSQPTEGEKLAAEIRASSSPTTKLTEGEALQHIMKDADRYEKFKAMDSKEQGKELVKAKNELEDAAKAGKEPTVTKVPEGQAGKKVRAKDGQPASPAQQAADRERAAKVREEGKKENFGAALEKHAQEMAGKYTPQSISLMHLPEIEATAKEIPGSETILKGLGQLRRRYKWSDEMYMEHLKEYIMKSITTGEEAK